MTRTDVSSSPLSLLTSLLTTATSTVRLGLVRTESMPPECAIQVLNQKFAIAVSRPHLKVYYRPVSTSQALSPGQQKKLFALFVTLAVPSPGYSSWTLVKHFTIPKFSQ
ncbi:hypothetical protein Rs2_18414 [Raphanus sativus]|nr:hypothetical protein Rs2_18414 [Raphanus sativus]